MLFLKDYIDRATSQNLRDLNHEYVRLTQLTFKLSDRLKSAALTPEIRSALNDELRWAEKNLVENYHAGVESKCQYLLDSLRDINDTFYYEERSCADFTYFISLQYFRTARLRHGLRSMPTYVPGHDPKRTADILNQIHATNVGAALFLERKAYSIVFLENRTPIPFIAGDQPVVNMLDPKATNDVELYYPLSPGLAILLTKDAGRFANNPKTTTIFEVERYNYAIYTNSWDQVYSNDTAYLADLVTLEKQTPPR
jgi:hypothetical protein